MYHLHRQKKFHSSEINGMDSFDGTLYYNWVTNIRPNIWFALFTTLIQSSFLTYLKFCPRCAYDVTMLFMSVNLKWKDLIIRLFVLKKKGYVINAKDILFPNRPEKKIENIFSLNLKPIKQRHWTTCWNSALWYYVVTMVSV